MFFKPLDPNLPTFEITLAASQTIKKGMALDHSSGAWSEADSGDIPGAIAAEDCTTAAGETTTTIRAWLINIDQIWIAQTKETAATKAHNYGAVGDFDNTSHTHRFDYSATTDKCMRCLDKTPTSDWEGTGTTEIYVRFLRSQCGANSTTAA
ncbi:MAG: hypothetical protein GX457_17760 [Thermotogaceae bacterium]|nr:hypothetical protein [Thermotogaceae bacterium]